MSEATESTTAPVVVIADDVLAQRLAELGVPVEVIVKIRADGATRIEELFGLTEADLVGYGMKKFPARAVLQRLVPTVPAVATVSKVDAVTVDPTKELAENEKPSREQITGFAGMLGADPMMMMMLLNGGGENMNLAGMVPISSMVQGYNPKRRDLYLMIMGQAQDRLGVPIVVIDSDGSINRSLTVQYIEGLEEGFEPAENNVYFDTEGTPHEVIAVGVDAQSVHDSDPLNPEKALQKNGMGIGNVSWHNVPLDVRQTAFFAVQTGEIRPQDDGNLSWLREHMKSGATRLVFHGQAPNAIKKYNEAARTGSLPTLRVMLSRSPRRPEVMLRRRRVEPRDLTGIGQTPRRDDHDI